MAAAVFAVSFWSHFFEVIRKLNRAEYANSSMKILNELFFTILIISDISYKL